MQNSFIDKHKVFVQKNVLNESNFNIETNILRLDTINNVVSGNKFFKLLHPVAAAINEGKMTIATFGGAYSNHIVATACYCKEFGINSVGIIRGEEALELSDTMHDAASFGMKLHYVSRESFKEKEQLKLQYGNETFYWVNEGGYSRLGAEGAKDIFDWIDETYTDIVCAVGTGTMMAGLIAAALPHQKITGICVLKGYEEQINDVKKLLTNTEQLKSYTILHDYHFGGYAKHPLPLLEWMNECYSKYEIPTDLIYTSKLCFGVQDLIKKGYFPEGSKIMVIHSGGLQGNSSLIKKFELLY